MRCLCLRSHPSDVCIWLISEVATFLFKVRFGGMEKRRLADADAAPSSAHREFG
jgi:hypothetical protein